MILAVLAVLIYFFFWRVGEPQPDSARSALVRAALESGDPQTWVAIGDSITAGTNSPFRYTERVEQLIETHYPQARLDFHNAGVPGDTTAGGLTRLERDVLSRDPNVVFVEFGWNDFKNGVKPEEFESDLRLLVDQLLAARVPLVYLLTTTQVDVALANWKIKKRNAIIRDIAEEKDCGLVDLYQWFSLAIQQGESLNELMSSDNIHPSGAGQEVIAQAILREFIP